MVGGELGFQQQHFESLDSKAGIILGFAATGVALTAGVATDTLAASVLLSIATLAAASAVLVSLGSLWPRKFQVLDVGRVRDDALDRFPDSLTRVAILDTRVQMIDANRRLLQQKARRMKTGASLLMAAIVLISAATMVERWEDTRMDENGHDTDGSQTTTSGQPSSESDPMPSEARPDWITYVEKGADPPREPNQG